MSSLQPGVPGVVTYFVGAFRRTGVSRWSVVTLDSQFICCSTFELISLVNSHPFVMVKRTARDPRSRNKPRGRRGRRLALPWFCRAVEVPRALRSGSVRGPVHWVWTLGRAVADPGQSTAAVGPRCGAVTAFRVARVSLPWNLAQPPTRTRGRVPGTSTQCKNGVAEG